MHRKGRTNEGGIKLSESSNKIQMPNIDIKDLVDVLFYAANAISPQTIRNEPKSLDMIYDFRFFLLDVNNALDDKKTSKSSKNCPSPSANSRIMARNIASNCKSQNF